MKRPIKYSMCWEDPFLVTSALNIRKKDSVLSIASGGENVFALLLMEPQRIVAIDNNPYQLSLVRLKAAAIQELTFEEFAQFLGYRESKQRKEYFSRCKKHLPDRDIEFWKSHPNYIEKGIIHCGKFETYLAVFRRTILRQVLDKDDIAYYLSLNDLQEQKRFYDTVWNTRMWRLLFSILFSKMAMQLIGREKCYFLHNEKNGISKYYLEKTEQGIVSRPASTNFFMHMILTGRIPVPFAGHPYLDASNFYRLKKLMPRLEYVEADVLSYLGRQKRPLFSKYNLSNIFEAMSRQEYEKAFDILAKTSSRNARLCYWNNLVKRDDHSSSAWRKEKSAELLKRKDRVFFYSNFIVERSA